MFQVSSRSLRGSKLLMEVYAYHLCSEAFPCHPDWSSVLVHSQSVGMGHQHVGEQWEQPCRREKTLMVFMWSVSEDAVS